MKALRALDDNVLYVLMGNQKAFRHFLAKRTGDSAAADELLQQGFLKAVESGEKIPETESLVPWFYTVLRNTLIDFYRANASRNEKYSRYLDELTTTGSDKTPAMDELKAEVCACMSRLLPTLKAEYADALKLVDLEERGIAEVAESLKVTPNNLMVRLHRARQALRTSLTRSCGMCAEHGCLDCSCE